MSIKVKYFLTLIIGLALGYLLGDHFHSHSNSDEDDTQESNKINMVKDVALSDVGLGIQDSVITQAEYKKLLSENADLKEALSESKTEGETQPAEISADISADDILDEDDFSKKLLSLMNERNKLSPENEILAQARLNDLKQNQDPRLNDLFLELPDGAVDLQAGQYKKHLIEEKDVNWAYDAERFLSNYYSTHQNSFFTLLRIDCRTSSCEIAGMVNFGNVGKEDEMISMQQIQEVVKLRDDLVKANGYDYLFAKTSASDMFFPPTKIENGIAAYSFFISRLKQ